MIAYRRGKKGDRPCKDGTHLFEHSKFRKTLRTGMAVKVLYPQRPWNPAEVIKEALPFWQLP